MGMLTNAHGQFSSKRAMGCLYLVGAFIIVSYKELNSLEITNPEMMAGLFLTGGGLLGIAVAEYFAKFKKTT